MADFTGIQVEGLQETLRAFGRIQKGMRKELRRELVEIAGVVAETARQIARQKGLEDSGDLIKRIHPGMRGSYAYVTDTAKRKSPAFPGGFNYPAIYEYGGSETRRAHGADCKVRNRSVHGQRLFAHFGPGTGHLGPRAFLEVALQQRAEAVVHGVEAMLDKLTSQAGFGRGGVL